MKIRVDDKKLTFSLGHLIQTPALAQTLTQKKTFFFSAYIKYCVKGDKIDQYERKSERPSLLPALLHKSRFTCAGNLRTFILDIAGSTDLETRNNL